LSVGRFRVKPTEATAVPFLLRRSGSVTRPPRVPQIGAALSTGPRGHTSPFSSQTWPAGQGLPECWQESVVSLQDSVPLQNRPSSGQGLPEGWQEAVVSSQDSVPLQNRPSSGHGLPECWQEAVV